MPPKKGKGQSKGSKKGGGGGSKGKSKGGNSSSGTSPASTSFVPVPVPVPVFPGAGPLVQSVQTPLAIQTPQSQVPHSGDTEDNELVEGEDYFFEDTLREVLRDALDPASVEVVAYPTIGAREFVTTVDAHLTDRYGDLAQRLANQIEDYEHRCNYAHIEHESWKAERFRLRTEKATLERQAEHERQAALNNGRRKRNAMQLMVGKRDNGESERMRQFLAARHSSGLYEFDFRGLDLDDPTTRARSQSSCRRCINWFHGRLDWIFPLRRDVKIISSHFGFAAGSFFDFHRSLLQLSVVLLLCHLYLLIQQFLEHWPTLLTYPISNPTPPRLPSQFMIGGFHDGNVAESWTNAFSYVYDNLSQPLPGASDINETYFNWLFTACPVVRHLRDCRVASVFAGRIDLESLDPLRAKGNYTHRYINNVTRTYEYSPFDLFRNNFQQVPGVKDEDYVIVGSFGEILNPSLAYTTWTKTCDINKSGRPDVGYPGYCSDSRVYWTGPFVLNSDTQNNHQNYYSNEKRWELNFGSSIEVYTGRDCPVATREDILQIAAGTNRNTVPVSGRNQWLAVRYQVASVGSVLIILFLVCRSWYKAELVYRIEYAANEISSVRWSSWVLGCWDFRFETEDDQELWKESFANELRAEMEEEINEEGEDNRDRLKAWCLVAKRILGSFINLIILAIAWASIIAAYIFQDNITNELSSTSLLGTIGLRLGAFAPNLTIAVVGLVLPSAIKLITRFEERTRDSCARWNLYRLFFAKIFNALLYSFLVGELVYSQPLVYTRFLSERDCQVDTGYACAEDQAGVRLLGLLVSECVTSLFLKPVLRLFRAALIFAIVSTFCRRRSQSPPPLPASARSPDDDGDDDDDEESLAGDSDKGRSADLEVGNRAFFKWPEFEIADSAVDTVYVQFLMWLTVRYIPTAAIAMPVILFLHFKWLKITLKYLASRPFITETSALRVNLQRVLLIICIAFALIVIISQFFRTPFEARCGPYDSHQAPARMTLSLLPPDAFDTISDTFDWFAKSWLLVLVIAFICILQNLLQLSVLQSANESVLEQMHISGEEQQGYLRLRRYRLMEKIELYRKRISWLGEVDKSSKGK
eukprot:TRINITY_DN1937_c0_g1_i1.p1 TRINITY_DN1937_c0_g1~~TRINITY_DN1937_c0_g1_i1.p1  ORF type:complete len:1097 (+),score=93.68 TRINITY_DN1937_c0_g1_i1:147-3437(+)